MKFADMKIMLRLWLRPDRYIRLPLESAHSMHMPTFRIAVMLHCFYVDDLPNLLRYVRNIPGPVDLQITTDTDAKRELILGLAPQSIVTVCPNRGRDIAPRFVSLRNVYQCYDLVLHIHTKRSPHRQLSGWAPSCLDDLIGSPDIARSVLKLFSTNPRLGVIAPNYYFPIREFIHARDDAWHCTNLARRLHIQFNAQDRIDFPAGSFFWARTAALKPLLDINLSLEEFEPEAGQLGGTLAHAVERMIFFSAKRAGLLWTFVGCKDPGLGQRVMNIASLASRGQTAPG